MDRVFAFMVARELRDVLHLVEQTSREPATPGGAGAGAGAAAAGRGWLDVCAAELQPVENRVTAPALKFYQSKLARGIRLWPTLLDRILKARLCRECFCVLLAIRLNELIAIFSSNRLGSCKSYGVPLHLISTCPASSTPSISMAHSKLSIGGHFQSV